MSDQEKMQNLLQELIGSKVELGIANGLYKGNYASRLEDLSPPAKDGSPLLGVAHPMFKGALLPMARNLDLNLRIESSGYFYQGEAEIIRHVINVPIPLLWLALKAPLEKVQRRMFVRVPCLIKGQAFLLEADSDEKETEEAPPRSPLPERRWFPIMLRDMSLGGVGVGIRHPELPFVVERGRYLLQAAIGDTEFFLICRLIKIFSADEEGGIVAGMAYEGLPAFTEKLMGGFIRQQELSSRGL